VIVLNSDDAVSAFSLGGNVTIGGNIAASAGPLGTGGSVQASLAHPAPMFSYSKSKGMPLIRESDMVQLIHSLRTPKVSLLDYHWKGRSSSSEEMRTAISTGPLSPPRIYWEAAFPRQRSRRGCMRSLRLRRALMRRVYQSPLMYLVRLERKIIWYSMQIVTTSNCPFEDRIIM
jgi:hypothetical protein